MPALRERVGLDGDRRRWLGMSSAQRSEALRSPGWFGLVPTFQRQPASCQPHGMETGYAPRRSKEVAGDEQCAAKRSTAKPRLVRAGTDVPTPARVVPAARNGDLVRTESALEWICRWSVVTRPNEPGLRASALRLSALIPSHSFDPLRCTPLIPSHDRNSKARQNLLPGKNSTSPRGPATLDGLGRQPPAGDEPSRSPACTSRGLPGLRHARLPPVAST
jgi:hypothetical protein